jgi:hypothetical protein
MFRSHVSCAIALGLFAFGTTEVRAQKPQSPPSSTLQERPDGTVSLHVDARLTRCRCHR